MPGLLSQASGLLSHTSDILPGGALDWATPKPPIVWDASFKQLIFALLLLFLSFLRGFIPPFALNLILLCIPPFVSFYELTLRRFLPQLPSMFTIVLKLYQNGVLTIGTVTWLLPQSMLGGLGAVGGVAMGGTAALMNGATAGASAVVGGVAEFASHGLSGAADLMSDPTKGIAEGISRIQSGELEVAENIAHLLAEQGASPGLAPTIAKDVIQATVGNTMHAAMGTANAITGAALQSVTNPAAAIGATQAAVTESATKLAHALDGVNPLSNFIHTNSQSHRVA